MNSIFVDQDPRENPDRFFSKHEATQYTGSLEEAQQELRHWVADLGWATEEPTSSNTVEITAEEMRELIREFVTRGDA